MSSNKHKEMPLKGDVTDSHQHLVGRMVLVMKGEYENTVSTIKEVYLLEDLGYYFKLTNGLVFGQGYVGLIDGEL